MKIDKLALDHFENEKEFGKAMEELFKSTYALINSQDFDEYQENFLDNIEDIDEWHISKAEKFAQAISKKFNQIQSQLTYLKATLAKGGQGIHKLNNQIF